MTVMKPITRLASAKWLFHSRNQQTPGRSASLCSHRLKTGATGYDVSKRGFVVTILLVTIILACVVALVVASVFGSMQKKHVEDSIGPRYSPEYEQNLAEQDAMLNSEPHWNVYQSDGRRVLVIPIDMAMQSIVEEYED